MKSRWPCPSTSVRSSMPARPWVVRIISRLLNLARLRHRVPTHDQSQLLLFRKGMCPWLRSHLRLRLRPLLHLHLFLPLSLQPRPRLRQPLRQTRVLAPVGMNIDRRTSRFRTHSQTAMAFTAHLRTMREFSIPMRTGRTDQMDTGIRPPNGRLDQDGDMDILAT